LVPQKFLGSQHSGLKVNKQHPQKAVVLNKTDEDELKVVVTVKFEKPLEDSISVEDINVLVISETGINLLKNSISVDIINMLNIAVSGSGNKVLDVVAVSEVGSIMLDITENATVRLVLGDVTDFEVRPCKT
jgi:hypothetical protein